MKEENRQENKMGTMPINPLLVSMAIPIVLAMLIQALYNVVDSVFVAKISEDALNAVSLAFPVQNLLIGVGVGTAVGVNALLSRALGEKKPELANRVANVGVLLALCTTLVFMILGGLFSRLFFRMQTDAQVIVDYGTTYLTICCVFCLGIFLELVYERILQATGRTFYTMITQGAGAIINIILDPVLIFGLGPFPRLEVAGAGIATVTGQFVAAGLAFYFNVTKNPDVSFSLKAMRPQWNIVRRIYSVGLPSIVITASSSLMAFALNRIFIQFTLTATAVLGAYVKLQSFVFMPVFGLNNGMVPIVAYNYGAGRRDRIVETIKWAMIYASSIMLLGTLAFCVFPTQLLSLFSPSDAMLAMGVHAFRRAATAFVMVGINIVASSVFQALGRGPYSLCISLSRQLVSIVPVAWLLSLTGDVNMVWWAFPIAEGINIFLCAFLMRRVLNRLEV